MPGLTRRLGESVAQLCRVASIRHVASFFGLDWKTVKDLDFASLQHQLGPVDLDGLEVIGMDEFAIQKGHRYATVIVEPMRKRVLWVGRGRGREDVRPFFELLGPERCKRLRAAVMDMNAGYELEVKHHCPQAAIVFDLFHVVAKYGREVIDRVRVDRANELRADKPARRVVKGARWLLLKNRESLAPGQHIQLNELLAANRALFVVHLLRDALKDLWSFATPAMPSAPGRAGTAKPGAAASSRSSASPRTSSPTCQASSPNADSLWAPTSSRASTTRSRSSSAWPTASATTPTSSSRSGPHSPELGEEPFFLGGW